MDSLAPVNESYHDVKYWDERYQKEGEEGAFDWFKSYKDVAVHIRKAIPNQEARIIMLGCGNSELSKDMYDDGYHNIVNVDYSPVVIEQMASKYADCIGMTWVVGDVQDLSNFPDDSFDIALDKATLDALMSMKGDAWDPPPEVKLACKLEVDEVIRVLKNDGVFIYITYGQPHFRKPHLKREGWSIETIELGDAFYYYFYVMKRDQPIE